MLWVTYESKTVNTSSIAGDADHNLLMIVENSKRGCIANRFSRHPRKNNSPLIAEVKQIDSDICDSHHNERLFEEHEAISKIASDPKFFYKFAKRSGKTTTNIIYWPLLTNDNTLSDDPKVIS